MKITLKEEIERGSELVKYLPDEQHTTLTQLCDAYLSQISTHEKKELEEHSIKYQLTLMEYLKARIMLYGMKLS